MEKVTVDVHIENKGKDSAEQGSVEQDSKDEIDVTALSDTELWEHLCAYGINPGPILPSTRIIYENKLLQLMKQCPGTAAELSSGVNNSENDGEGKTTEVVIQTNGLKVTTEHTSGSDNKSPADVAERQKKLLSSDVEHSLAKIVAELQEILPEGKVPLHRSQGLRKKACSPERNCRQKTSDLPHQDYGYPDVNVTVGQSARRRKAVKENPPSVKQDLETKCHVVPGRSREGRIPIRVKFAAFAIFMFLLFVYVTMETNFHNPFTSYTKGK